MIRKRFLSLLEYQAKQLLGEYNINLQKFTVLFEDMATKTDLIQSFYQILTLTKLKLQQEAVAKGNFRNYKEA
jgi:hypothetical protein